MRASGPQRTLPRTASFHPERTVVPITPDVWRGCRGSRISVDRGSTLLCRANPGRMGDSIPPRSAGEFWTDMRIELENPTDFPDVLRFLRERGCIAYAVDATTLEIIRPRSLGRHESDDILVVMEEYQSWRPQSAFRVTD